MDLLFIVVRVPYSNKFYCVKTYNQICSRLWPVQLMAAFVSWGHLHYSSDSELQDSWTKLLSERPEDVVLGGDIASTAAFQG